MFNLFGKKDSDADNQVFIDKTYVNSIAKMNAIVELAKTQHNHIFICWFPETAEILKSLFNQEGIAEDRIVIARYIKTNFIKDKTPVFTEHYPLHEIEIELIKNWEAKNIIVFSAMDEPLFKHFGSEKLIPLMKMMGMKEAEVIEHSMVTKSIIKGQQKIAAQVQTEHSANSQADWMRKNIKPTDS